jgi:hypothetical protein
MTKLSRASVAALLLVAAGLCACASEGVREERWISSMLAEGDPGSKVAVLRTNDIGRTTPTAGCLSALQRAPGVRSARRGAGRNELYALVDSYVDPETLVNSLGRDGYETWVVRVVTQADLAAEDTK